MTNRSTRKTKLMGLPRSNMAAEATGCPLDGSGPVGGPTLLCREAPRRFLRTPLPSAVSTASAEAGAGATVALGGEGIRYETQSLHGSGRARSGCRRVELLASRGSAVPADQGPSGQRGS